jgi:hypothetical protein
MTCGRIEHSEPSVHVSLLHLSFPHVWYSIMSRYCSMHSVNIRMIRHWKWPSNIVSYYESICWKVLKQLKTWVMITDILSDSNVEHTKNEILWYGGACLTLLDDKGLKLKSSNDFQNWTVSPYISLASFLFHSISGRCNNILTVILYIICTKYIK